MREVQAPFGPNRACSFNSYTAVVASVAKDKEGQVHVDDVWIVADPGHVINPDRVRAQTEVSVINGMYHFFNGGVTHKNGAVVENNFDTARWLRMPLT